MKIIAINDIIGMYDMDGRWLRGQLNDAKGEDVRIEINSPGGYVYDGIEMYNLIKSYKGKVEVHITGIAASMASYVALAGDRITAEDNATYFIHNVWGLVSGDYKNMQDAARVFESLSKILGRGYSARSGKGADEIKKMMDDETYFFGNEMKEAGFVDEIVSSGKTESREDAVAFAKLSVEDCFQKIDDKWKEDIEKTAALLNIKAQIPAEAGQNNIKEVKIMNLETIKAQHSDLYNQIFQAGIDEERRRVAAHIKLGESLESPKMVFENIISGSNATAQDIFAGYLAESMKAKALGSRQGDDPGTVNTPAVDPKAAEKEIEQIMCDMLGIKEVK